MTQALEDRLQEVLAKHREDPPPGLVSTLPIHHQLDRDFCAAVTRELKQCCARWEVRRATQNLAPMLPAESGVYMFAFESTLRLEMDRRQFSPLWVLYVGRAGDVSSTRTIRDRYRGEYSKYVGTDPEALWGAAPAAKREERLARYLTMYPLWFWYATISERSRIRAIEDRLIKLLAPPLNRSQLPRLRYRPEQIAFQEKR